MKANPAQLTVGAVILTGIIVLLGHWQQDKKITVKLAVGTGALALFLAFMTQVDAKLAQMFALLILLAAAFNYLPGIVKELEIK